VQAAVEVFKAVNIIEIRHAQQIRRCAFINVRINRGGIIRIGCLIELPKFLGIDVEHLGCDFSKVKAEGHQIAFSERVAKHIRLSVLRPLLEIGVVPKVSDSSFPRSGVIAGQEMLARMRNLEDDVVVGAVKLVAGNQMPSRVGPRAERPCIGHVRRVGFQRKNHVV
jgi:hypothetical protein